MTIKWSLVPLLLLQWLALAFVSINQASDPPPEEYDPDFFPPLIDSDDISYFFSTYDLDGLHWALTNIFERSSRNLDVSNKERPLPNILVARGGGDTYTSEYKLRHDLMQLEYLVGVLSETKQDEEAVKLIQEAIPIYKAVLANIPPLDELEATKGLYAFTSKDYELGIANIYNKALYTTTAYELYPNWKDDALLNSLDWDGVQKQWFGESSQSDNDASAMSSDGVIVLDNLLSEQALDCIRKLLLRNTHW
jgi:hypothetical protein